MSISLNKVFLLGFLGADGDLRTIGSGSSVLKLRLATNESYFDRDKVLQTRTEWHNVTVWGARGAGLAKILKKGERIFVEGRIQTSSYEKDGSKRYRTEIIASNVILSGSRPASRPEGHDSSNAARTSYDEPEPPEDFGSYDDDTPF